MGFSWEAPLPPAGSRAPPPRHRARQSHRPEIYDEFPLHGLGGNRPAGVSALWTRAKIDGVPRR